MGMGCDAATGVSTAGCMRIAMNEARSRINDTIFFIVRTILSEVYLDHILSPTAFHIQQHFVSGS